MEGSFHKNVFGTKAALRRHVPLPPVNFNTKFKDPTIQGSTNRQDQKCFL